MILSHPENQRAMHQAMEKVRGELGREYQVLINGERLRTGNLLKSVNPSKPSEIVGSHRKGHVGTGEKDSRSSV